MAAGQSWGRYPSAQQTLLPINDRAATLPAFDGLALPRGNGRSYGDSCLNPDGVLLCARGLDRFIAFDPASGVLRCEAGVTLNEIIELVLPQGWFLPVTPGTRYVTVAGAIANDVHGKNHHRTGNFGHHVRAFELLRSDGERRVCTPDHTDLVRSDSGRTWADRPDHLGGNSAAPRRQLRAGSGKHSLRLA